MAPNNFGTESNLTITNNNKNDENENNSGEWRVGDLLAMKLKGERLTPNHLNYLIQKITDGSLDDCQLGAFLAAVMIKGMDREETACITRFMRDSGRVLSWPAEWRTVDKHSTGGVGDKVSLPLAPALAALGLKVPMISGRGLGHTGGTLDKLESIPGYRVSLTEEAMKKALEEAGCCIVGQTEDITPADRRMYSARDITSTVSSLPLIVSSIISKKAAGGMKALVLDVKFGQAAFMKTQEEAQTLAEALVEVASSLGIRTSALTTEMNTPIGRSIGNALEVVEAMECLRGRGPTDLRELVVKLGGELVGVADGGEKAIEAVLDDGRALKAFEKMLVMQGVSEKVASELCGEKTNYSMLPRASNVTPVHSHCTGVVVGLEAMTLAQVCQRLGAGRSRAGDPVNLAVGVVLKKNVGERVSAGECWAEVHHDAPLTKAILTAVHSALEIDEAMQPFPTPSRIRNRFA